MFALALLVALLAAAMPARAQPGVGVTALAWEGDALWVGTLRGLERWEDGETRAVEFPAAGRAVTALLPDDDALWVGTRDGLLRREPDGAWREWARGDDGLASGWIAALATHEGATVAGTFGGGALRWDGAAWAPLGAGGPTQITALASARGTLWVGTASGLWAWAGDAWRREPEPEARVNALLVADGTLWVGAEDGLHARAAGGAWRTTLAGERVTALAAMEGVIVAATARGLVDESGGPLPDGPRAGTGALAARGERLAIGTLGAGLVMLPYEPMSAPERPPVVLVHGLDDSNRIEASQLRFMAEWLARDGYPFALAPTASEAPLLDNVEALRETIARVRDETGAERVIVIAHSFGGLVARAYLASGTTDVMGLATLGTPHAGARLAYDLLVADLPDATPSEIALLPEHVARIATDAGDEVPQLHIGGTRLPSGVLLDGFPPSDGYVTAASAIAPGGATRLLPLLHGWTLDSLGAGIESLTWPAALYHGTLRPWMADLARGEPWENRVEAPLTPEPGFTRRPLLDRTLAPGESATVEVTLDGAPATWLLEAEGVRTTLVAPDGARYTDDALFVSETVARLPYEGFGAARFWSTRERPGTWRAELRNEGEAPTDVRLSLIRPDDEPLTISLGRLVVDGGDTLEVAARGPAGLALEVTLGDERAPMREWGPGEYGATLDAPTAAGYHRVRVGNDEIERFAVVVVRSDALATLAERGDVLRCVCEADAALLVTGADGRTRLLGPFRLRPGGLQEIPLPPGTVRWTALDATHAILPVRPPRR